MHSFGSDNHSGIHPDILKAIEEANRDHVHGYGEDIHTETAQKLFADIFGCKESYIVFNGTGANVFALKCATRSFNSVICAATAHINVDECGAPEHHTGCKLVTVPTPDGKLTPDNVMPVLTGFGFQHHAQPKVISISQPTELGTLYTLDEIKALAGLAHSHGMFLHIDGARLSNAIAALGCTPKELTLGTGADLISLGGTKNGMMIGEAVLFFNPALCTGNGMYERKQAMQLASKMRFISAQFYAYLKDGLWLKMAAHSNRMAQYLKERIGEIPQIRITQKVETNGIFAIMPKELAEKVRKRYFFYTWDEAKDEVRWLTSFDTTTEDIDNFIAYIKENS